MLWMQKVYSRVEKKRPPVRLLSGSRLNKTPKKCAASFSNPVTQAMPNASQTGYYGIRTQTPCTCTEIFQKSFISANMPPKSHLNSPLLNLADTEQTALGLSYQLVGLLS